MARVNLRIIKATINFRSRSDLQDRGGLQNRSGLEVISTGKKPFDNKRAREIREKEDLSQAELAEELHMNRRTLSDYERGYRSPSNPPKLDSTERYLSWLREKGYKQYNL